MQRNTGQTHANLKQQIYQDLKHKLIYCIYPPGTALNELMLTKEYNVSRTPVREALSQLELDGYVKIIPKKGIHVTELTVEDIVHIFQTRIEIEPLALRLGVPYLDMKRLLDFRQRFKSPPADPLEAFELDTQMHLYLISCCRNSYLIGMMNRLFEDNTRMIISTGLDREHLGTAAEEHLRILDSLISMGDIRISSDLLREHILTCRQMALRFFG